MQNTWPFPAVADQQRAYIDFGGAVGLLWRRGRSPMQVCDFCRTAGALKARCEVCGAGQSPYSDASPKSPDKSDLRLAAVPLHTIALVVGRTLILPLLMFTAFSAWYAMHHQSRDYNAQENQPKSQLAAAHAASTIGDNRVTSYATLPQRSSEKAMTGKIVIPRKPRGAQRSSGAEAALNLCVGRNVLMRAVCRNNVCAAPYQAQLPQCAETVAQRRIDEARRNPVLVN